MGSKKSLTNTALIALGAIFIACLVLTVAFNNKTQTKIFWDNQQDKLALVTEKCAVELDAWAEQQKILVANIAGEVESGRLLSQADYSAYLSRIVAHNEDIQAAYLALDNGVNYLNDDYTISGADDEEFLNWYKACQAAGDEIIFTEPYVDGITGKLVISCLKAITMPDGVAGVLGIDIALAKLNSMINSLNPSANGGAYLVSEQGKLLTYIDPDFLPRIENGKAVFLSAEDVMAQVTVLETTDKYLDRGIEISYINDYDGIIKYEAVTSVPHLGWILGVNIPISDYDAAVQAVINDQIPIILLAVLMSVISIIYAFVVVSSIRREHNMQKNVEIAQAASKTKSDFLSRMSHEMRTPMNAIIGMARIADNSDDIGKLRYCLANIEASSTHLLRIINDVLDMSKIEAGKLELDLTMLNMEKMLMKICNLIIDKTAQKDQKLSIVLDQEMSMHYIGDELRLTQVLTNLLGNAVKFTPEQGRITLKVDELEKAPDYSIIRFAVSDNGIGMTKEQQSRLFTSFEQADGSISRRFGGTGLGLAISKSIVEKMNGQMRVESAPNQGSTFSFEIKLARPAEQNRAVIFDGISPADIKVLVVDEDSELRDHFKSITERFGVRAEEAVNGQQALRLVESAKEGQKPYDVIFLDYHLPDMSGLDTARSLSTKIDKNTVIIMTSFLDRGQIEDQASSLGIRRFIAKPLFPSAVLNAINESVGATIKELEMKVGRATETADFSGYSLLLVEDVAINQEIFISLLEDTHIKIDTAENGLVAVEKFQANPHKYDIIIMDVQMPEMDGHQATRTIRALNVDNAATIPIIAMTANVFKEDIDQCLQSGMNDHLAKPIDAQAAMEKIGFYLKQSRH